MVRNLISKQSLTVGRMSPPPVHRFVVQSVIHCLPIPLRCLCGHSYFQVEEHVRPRNERATKLVQQVEEWKQ